MLLAGCPAERIGRRRTVELSLSAIRQIDRNTTVRQAGWPSPRVDVIKRAAVGA